MSSTGGSVQETPLSYTFTRWFFKLLLKVFYGTIVVENAGYLPKEGESCIVCANHGNSLTDPMLLVTSLEGYLRVTAKSTLFGQGTFTSWIVEKLCCLPIKRRIDHPDSGDVDNAEVMERLYQALDEGHSVCMFPEGVSKYRSALSPLKNGVARIVSESLTRNRNNPQFEITLLTCSITYMNRQHFRSDVLVSFNRPIKLKPSEYPSLLAPASLQSINQLTSIMADQISTGTFDAQSWDVIRAAKVAARIYAPLGTRMSLGDYVRVTRAFMEKIQNPGKCHTWKRDGAKSPNISDDTLERGKIDIVHLEEDKDRTSNMSEEDITILAKMLTSYNAKIVHLGLGDDQIRVGPLRSSVILSRIIMRTLWLAVLLILSFPGFILWAPVFVCTSYISTIYSRQGAPEDTWDEITQNKILTGIFSIPCVWLTCTALSFPNLQVAILLPCFMWMSLRWIEDTVSTFRALVGLTKLLWVGRPQLQQLIAQREHLHSKVLELAVGGLGLPENPEKYFQEQGPDEKGRVRGTWDSAIRYFSIRRRRKNSWDEILRIWPHQDFE